MLAKEESLFPAMYANLRKALVPLMDGDAYEAMGKKSSEVCCDDLVSVVYVHMAYVHGLCA